MPPGTPGVANGQPSPHHGSPPRKVLTVEMYCRRERTPCIFHLLRSKKKKTNRTDGLVFLIIKVECSGTPENGLRTLQDLFWAADFVEFGSLGE